MTCALSVVILGASGDLARKKTFPALYSLYLYNQLPSRIRIYAYSRSLLTRELLLSQLEQKLLDLSSHILKEDDMVSVSPSINGEGISPTCETLTTDTHPRISSFMDLIEFHQCSSYDDEKSATKLNEAITAFDHDAKVKRLIIYLALPPGQFIPAVRAFRRQCWRERNVDCDDDDVTPHTDSIITMRAAEQRRGSRRRRGTIHGDTEQARCQDRGSWTHIVVEKPFGHDQASALAMSKELSLYATEEEIFRIDHYLGKEMVLNLFVLRFANSFIAPLWNRHHIKCVRVTFKEAIGTYGRGGYFDQFGIIKDVVQNHLLQIVSLVAMEPPVTLNDEHIRDEKVKLLKAIESPTLDYTVLGQYTRGTKQRGSCDYSSEGGVASVAEENNDPNRDTTLCDSDGEEDDYIPGYLDDPTVPHDSKCPTFVTTVLWVNNERWSGVPFILKAGKALEATSAEIRIQFHGPKNHLYAEELPRNELVFRIQPDDAVYMKMLSKKPGLSADGDIVETELDLSVLDRHGITRVNDAYERLLLDVMHSDKKKTDELLEAWRIFDPLISSIEQRNIKPLPYPAGSHGPAEHYDLIKCVGYSRYDGYVWHRSVSK